MPRSIVFLMTQFGTLAKLTKRRVNTKKNTPKTTESIERVFELERRLCVKRGGIVGIKRERRDVRIDKKRMSCTLYKDQ